MNKPLLLYRVGQKYSLLCKFKLCMLSNVLDLDYLLIKHAAFHIAMKLTWASLTTGNVKVQVMSP